MNRYTYATENTLNVLKVKVSEQLTERLPYLTFEMFLYKSEVGITFYFRYLLCICLLKYAEFGKAESCT